MMVKLHKSVVAGLVGLLLCGCRNMNNTQTGTLAGGGLGALAGAVVGQAAGGHAGTGALIGAATGAVTGGLIGNAEDAREERDAAIVHAHYAEARSRAFSEAITEDDVLTMTRNGVGSAVIINAIRTRGCRWDGTPEDIIRLKQQGVGDDVISVMQKNGLKSPVILGTAPSKVYYTSATPVGGVVVVEPGVRYYGPRRYGHRHYRHW